MDSEKLVRGELIGLGVNVAGKNINGKIIDETKNSILIESKNGRKMIMKKNNQLEFILLDERIIIDGKQLVLRPEERIKKG